MATVKPRINCAMPPQMYDVISRLAKLQRRSRSAVVVELLEQATPVLERVVVVGEAALRAQVDARETLRSSLEKAEAAVLPHVTAAMDQLDMLLPKPEGQGGGSAATVMTDKGGPRAPTERSEVARAPRRSRALKRAGDPRPVTRGSARAAKRGQKRRAKSAKTK